MFANLPKRHLRSIAKVTGVREYEKGASVIREGDPGSAFYVRCLTLDKSDFAKILASEPVLATRVVRELAARLRRSEGSALS